eukprot:TRINITY_DN955_c2_g1_i1.p1 TRINITY_DN955_c2_g1~~TRINITY_DN955_c2_g1_i1.p1  ORF type:complete len:296 (-),score=80.36 TRINITY_DN955_c2_g1_i1:247-1134(-)
MSMYERVKALFDRDEQECSAIATDFPRIAKNFSLYERGVQVLPSLNPITASSSLLETEETEDTEDTGGDMGKEEEKSLVHSQMPKREQSVISALQKMINHVDQDSSLASRVPEIFQGVPLDVPSIVSETLLEHLSNTRTIRLLKACNQSTVAPAAGDFKLLAMLRHPCRDFQGYWEVDIHLEEDEVRVSQYRKEQTMDSVPRNKRFICRWKLDMFFDPDLRDLRRISFKVVDKEMIHPEETNEADVAEIFSFLDSITEDSRPPTVEEIMMQMSGEDKDVPKQKKEEKGGGCCTLL